MKNDSILIHDIPRHPPISRFPSHPTRSDPFPSHSVLTTSPHFCRKRGGWHTASQILLFQKADINSHLIDSFLFFLFLFLSFSNLFMYLVLVLVLFCIFYCLRIPGGLDSHRSTNDIDDPSACNFENSTL